jgi:hypothetical protein
MAGEIVAAQGQIAKANRLVLARPICYICRPFGKAGE